jgi:quinoprotein dehydrogenase-associated probable ABC transporter substrate-binding protein
MTRLVALAGAVALLQAAWPAMAQTQTQAPELVARTELRVCADPNNLPYSNKAGEGFENRIAAIFAKDLGLPLTTVWFPQVIGFVRNTLRAGACDLVMGTVSGDNMVEATNPYYHSGYMIVTRTADHITATSVGDPALAGKRIGLIAATPPTDLLLRHDLMSNVHSYSLAVDTRFDSPGRAMLQDLVDGNIDVGLLWGPIAGFWIKHDNLPLTASFLEDEPGSTRLDYYIAMGVRSGEPQWRRRINQEIDKHRAEIDAILAEYNVPLLDAQKHPIVPASR